MKFMIHAALVAASLAIAGCTTDSIDDRPQFDRNGNPNFDTRGRYIGCHGLGCKVDDPDNEDQSIDDRPQYDRNGNPNFDTHGNYQGCNGIGCEVDTPDDDNSSNDSDSG
ncbi:MAG: hypothetical protein E5X74_25060 [Mesorhizobium sp.]|uniref:hypothetical protein n=1 Tax=Mesorhizobium sp. TaxID=1871066 RepID=UPI000FE7E6B2|nr:hypothetical protein [Mesorhizobium sp.]RWM24861.1 MAG: hypothetical protein EOR74_22060 [Mesorhizobium sp.]TIO74525.1 MAG: hypothetical protein E5X75_23665 [Mesorhizobium sp.]TIO82330.1 MAG: hypothetical protein E5X74_25060 [Mesorhizobium sp.]